MMRYLEILKHLSISSQLIRRANKKLLFLIKKDAIVKKQIAWKNIASVVMQG